MTRLPKTAASLILIAAFVVPAAEALAEKKGSNSASNDQIFCANRAVNDYWDNVKACEQNLSDIPDQLAQCKADAKDDLARAKARCMGTAARSQGLVNRSKIGGLKLSN